MLGYLFNTQQRKQRLDLENGRTSLRKHKMNVIHTPYCRGRDDKSITLSNHMLLLYAQRFILCYAIFLRIGQNLT